MTKQSVENLYILVFKCELCKRLNLDRWTLVICRFYIFFPSSVNFIKIGIYADSRFLLLCASKCALTSQIPYWHRRTA